MQLWEATLNRVKLSREDVIRLTGSNAPDIPPELPEQERSFENYRLVCKRLKIHKRFLVVLGTMGWPGSTIGMCEGVTREAVNKRLRKLGLRKKGRPKKTDQKIELVNPLN